MSNLYHAPRAEAQNASGGVLSGGKKFFYETGTTTLLDTYTTKERTTANTNPVVADSAGRWGPIWLKDQDYRVILKDSDDVVIWDHDPIQPGDAGVTSNTIASTISTTGGVNAYAATVNTTFAALTNGQEFTLKASFTNVAVAGQTTTLEITDSAGTTFPAVTIKKHHDIDLGSSDIENGQWFTVKYDGTNFQLLTPLATVPSFLINLIKNGDFRIEQRRGDGTAYTAATTPLNDNDTVLLDRWILLSDGDDAADVSQETSTVPVGSHAAIKLLVTGTNNKKFGIFQIIEAKDAEAIIGGFCSLSFKARRTGSSIGNLRAAIMAWSGTADVVTSDPVNNWLGAGSNPTPVANWLNENIPASLATLTTSYQTFKIENISIDTASTKNVGVFIWIDDVTTTAGDAVFITDVQLVPGSAAVAFQRRQHAEELALCEKHYTKTFPQGVIPVQNVGDEVGAIHIIIPVANQRCAAFWKFPVTMFATPNLTYFSPGAASTDWWNASGTPEASGASSSLGAGDQGVTIVNASTANDGVTEEVAIHATAEAEF